jgi:tetratricopeptide (TPR) repeat protein
MLSYLAEYHAMIGEAKPARDTITEALRIAPADPEVLYYAGIVYAQAGEDKRALESLQRSLAAGYPAASVRDTPNFDRLQNDPLYKSLVATPAESQKGKAQ